MTSRPFAAFDIDGTLVRWQMYHAIVEELAKDGAIQPEQYQIVRAARQQWKNRGDGESFYAYEHTLIPVYKQALLQLTPQHHEQAIAKAFQNYKDQVYVYTRELVRSLKQRGHFLIAISGSHQEIIDRLGEYYGFDAAVGAVCEIQDGAYTGVINNPYDRKGEILTALIQQHGLTAQGSIAVGDSRSDLAMLEQAETPIAFNPNRQLFAAAQERGWKIVVERKNMWYELERGSGDTYLLAQTNA